jgi:hypothetical protein
MECNDEEISLMKTFKRWAKGIFLKATKDEQETMLSRKEEA